MTQVEAHSSPVSNQICDAQKQLRDRQREDDRDHADDKFEEFKYFVKTIQQKWRTQPEDLLNLQEYVHPDKYGHSGYAIEDSGLIVEFFYFDNKLCQSTINLQDSEEAQKWIGYLDGKFGDRKPDRNSITGIRNRLKLCTNMQVKCTDFILCTWRRL